MTKKRALVAVPLALVAGLLATVVALSMLGLGPAGPAGTGGDSSEASGAGGADADTGAEPGTAPKDGSGTRTAGAVTPLSRALISTGQITLHTDRVSRARQEVQRLVSAWGGVVADEDTVSDARGRVAESTLTLRVPSPRFAEAMRALAGLGEVEHESRSSEDVTTRVIDNEARIRAAERSVRKIEDLLSRARDLGDIIAIESDLARRQADLDSLRSQQAWLTDQTSLSTINVYLSRPELAREEETRLGFLAGLARGWHALTGAMVLGLTALGAVLPFAVLVLLLGVPAWVLVRRRTARVSAGSAPARTA